MTDTAEKTGILEFMMLMVIPASTMHFICTTFSFPYAFPLKAFVALVLLAAVFNDIRSHQGNFFRRLGSWAAALSAAERVAFAVGAAALFNAVVIGRPVGPKSFQEPFGFILAIAGIGSFFRRTGNGKRFLIRTLWILVFLCLLQCAVSVLHSWRDVAAAIRGPISTVDYIRTSWDIAFYYRNPNSFGFYMMAGGTAAFALMLHYALRGGKAKAAAALLFCAVCALGILLSASRASMFGFAAAAVLCLFIPSVLKRLFGGVRRHPLFASLAFFVVIVGGFLVFHNYIDIFLKKFDNGTIYRSAFWSQLLEDPSRHGAIDVVTASRYSFWKGFVVQQMQSFPSLDFFFGRGTLRPINPVDPQMELHNIYFEIWGKYGIFCAVGLIAFLVMSMKKVLSAKRAVFLAGVSFAFVLHGCFEDKIFVNSLQPQLLYLYIVLLFPFCSGESFPGKTETGS